ncbi:MAG TPA: hypothetical protein VK539_16140 [Myxococcaceae bacterium]|nr:hypothetical protein [Myxococcaceae bacterium]
MKSLAALCFLVVFGCATTQTAQVVSTSEAASEGGGRTVDQVEQLASPVRLETPAGTFLVSPGHAEDFARALAGEATPTRFYAGADTR